MIHSPLFDHPAHLIPRGPPLLQRRIEPIFFREQYAAVGGRPAHHLGMHEMQWPRADFPDPPVRELPLADGHIDDLRQEFPIRRAGTMSLLTPLPGQLDNQTVHVGLVLTVGSVTD